MNTSGLLYLTGMICGAISVESFAQGDTRNEVISAEYHFAERASSTNTKEAFLSHLAPDGLIVRQGELVNGIQDWQERQANNSLLSWYPSYVDVARSGDLGLSTGPWEFWKSRQDSTASVFGHFVSIWKKQQDGEWKVAIDIGVNHRAHSTTEPPVPNSGSGLKAEQKLRKWNLLFSNAELLGLEKELIEKYRKEGPAVLASSLADNARVYRPGESPAIGKAARTTMLNRKDQYSFSPVNCEISRSGDWGYIHGNVVIITTENGKQEELKGTYMRLWKKSKQMKWEIALEVISL